MPHTENYKCPKCGFAWHFSVLRERGRCNKCHARLRVLREPAKTVKPYWPSVQEITNEQRRSGDRS